MKCLICDSNLIKIGEKDWQCPISYYKDYSHFVKYYDYLYEYTIDDHYHFSISFDKNTTQFFYFDKNTIDKFNELHTIHEKKDFDWCKTKGIELINMLKIFS